MAWLRHPLYSIATVLAIGIACGWIGTILARRNRERAAAHYDRFTAISVGLAGAFVGFHLAMLSNLATDQVLLPFLVALLLSALAVWIAARHQA